MRKFLVYIMTYVLMMFVGLGGVYIFTGNKAPLKAEITIPEPTVMDKMVNNIMQSKNLQLDADLVVNFKGQHYATLSLDVSLDLKDGINDLACSGTVSIEKSREVYNIDFTYLDNVIYIKAFDLEGYANINDLGKVTWLISDLVNQVMPIDMNLLSMIDMSALMDMASNLKVEENDNITTLTLELPGSFGSAIIVLDSEYNISKIDLSDLWLTLYGYQVFPSINIKTSKELANITEPENYVNFADIGEELTLLNAVSKTIKNDFNLSAKYNYLNLDLTKNKNNVKLSTFISNEQIDISFFNNIAFISYGDLKIKAGEQDIDKVIETIEKYLGIEIDFENIDLMSMLLTFAKDFDLKNLSLSQLMQYITYDNNIYTFMYDNIKVDLTVENDLLKTLSTTINGETLLVSFNYNNVVELSKPQGDYITITDLITKVEAIRETITSDNVKLATKLAFNGYEVEVFSDYAFNNGDIYMSSSLSYQGFDVNIYFVNQTLYVEYQDFKVKINEETINNLSTIIGLNNNELNIQNISMLAIKIINSTQIVNKGNIFTILNGENAISIETNSGKISKLSANIEGFDIESVVNYQEITQKTIVDSDYVQLNNLLDLVSNTLNLVSNDIYTQVSLNYKDLVVNGYVNFINNEISANLILNYNNISANVYLLQNVIYVDFMGAKVKFAIKDLDKALAFIEKFGITLPEMNFNIVTADIVGLLLSSTFVYTNDKLSFNYDDIVVNLNLANNNISYIDFAYSEFNGEILLNNNKTPVVLNGLNQYVDLISLLPSIESILETINYDAFKGDLVLQVTVNNQLVNVPLNYSFKFTNDYLIAKVTTTIESVDVEIYYEDNMIYVAIDDIFIKANISELDKVLEFVQTQFNIKLPNVELNTMAIVKAIIGILSINDLSFVNTIVADADSFSIELGQLKIYAEFTNVINYVQIKFTEFNYQNTNLTNILVELNVSTQNVLVQFVDRNYIDINDLIVLTESAINTYKAEAISGQIVVTIPANIIEKVTSEQTITFNYNYSYANANYKFDISTTILNNELKLAYVDGNIYLSYQGVKLYASVKDIMSYLPTMTISVSEQQIIGMAVEAIKAITMTYEKDTLNIAYENNNLSVTTNGEIISNIVISNEQYGKLEITLNKVANYNDFEITNDFVYADNLIELVNNIITLATNDIYANVNVTYQDVSVQGLVTYVENDIRAKLTITYQNYTANLTYIDEIIYIEYAGAKLRLNINDIDKVIAFVQEFGVTMPEMKVNANVDTTMLLVILEKVNLSYTKDMLRIVFEEILTNITLTNNNVDTINVTYQDVSISITPRNVGTQIADVNTNEYLDITTLMPSIKAVYNTILNNSFNGTLTISASVNGQVISVPLNYNIKLTNSGIVAKVTTTIESVEVEIYYANNIVYVAIDDMFIKASINELDKVLAFVKTQFSVVMPEMNIETRTLVETIIGILAVDDLSFVNTIITKQDSFSMNLGNLKVYLDYADEVNYINLALNELIVKNITLRNIVLETTLNTNDVTINCKSGNYIDINDLIVLTESAINTYKAEAISGQIVVTIPANLIEKVTSEQTITFNYNYSYANANYKFDISTTILNNELKLAFVDGNIYLSYQGVKLYASVKDIMSYLPTMTISVSEQQIIGMAVEAIKAITMTYEKDTLNIAYENNNLSVTTNGEIISNIVISNEQYGKLEITLNKVANYNDFEITNDFVYADNLIELVNNVINLLKESSLYATLNINAFGLDLKGFVNYENNELTVQLGTTILGKSLLVRLIDNVIYVDFDGLKLKFAIKDYNQIIALLNDYKLLDSSESLNIAFGKSQIMNLLNALSVSYDGNQIVLKINYNLADFGLDLSKVNLKMLGIDLASLQENTLLLTTNLQNNTLYSFSVAVANDLTLGVVLEKTKQKINNDISNYLDVVELLPFIKEFADSYLNNGISGQITLNIPAVEKLIGSVVLNYKVDFKNLRVNLTTRLLNQDLEINIYNGSIYLAIEEMKYTFKLSEIKNLITFISQNFLGKALPQTSTQNLLDSVTLGNINLDVINGNELQIVYNDIALFVTTANGFNIALNYKDIDAQITINKTTNNFVDSFIGFMDIYSLLNKAQSINDIVKMGSIQLQAQTTIQNELIDVVAEINFKKFMTTQDINDLEVQAKATAFGITAEIQFVENVVYISSCGLNIKFVISDINEVMALLKKHNAMKLSSSKMNIALDSLITYLSANENQLTANLKGISNLKINFVDDIISQIIAENIANTNYSATIYVNNKNEKLNLMMQERYSNVVDLLPLCDRILTIYEQKAFSADAEIKGIILGHEQTLGLSINVNFEAKLALDIALTFEGIELGVHLRNDIIYLDVDGLRIKVGMNDIPTIVNFANENFGTKLTIPEGIENKTPVKFVIDLIKSSTSGVSTNNLDLSMIGYWLTNEKGLEWTLKNGIQIISSNSGLLNLGIILAEYTGSVNVASIGKASKLISININDYKSVQTYIDLANSVNNTLKTKQYKFVANAQVYNGHTKSYDIGIDASLSLVDGIYGGGTATVTGSQNITVNVHYDNSYLYVDYDGLKVKMNNDSMVEIVGILLALFGFDISSMSFFENVDLDFNLDNMGAIMPNIDLGNPLTIMNAIESISYDNNRLTIGLDGKYLLNDENAQTMQLVFVTNGEKLTNIELNDIYSSKTEHTNVQIELVDYQGLPTIEGTWYDISTISELLKGIINTSELNDYHIVGTAYITILGINLDIPVDIQIKLVDKKPVIMATLGPMLVMSGVNNYEGVSSPGNRLMTLYYKDGFVYFYVIEETGLFNDGLYEKKLKVALSTVLSDPMYYVQYLLGFEDTIIDKINEALSKSKIREEPMKMGKVLTGYDYSNEYYNIKVNLGEIANNSDLKETTLNIKTSYNETAQKEYTTHLKFNMEINFGITMNVATYTNKDTSQALQLVDIGKEVSLTACSTAESQYSGYVKGLYDFINNYQYAENEEWDAEDGSWKKSSERNFTITLVTAYGETPTAIVQKMGTNITLPTLTTITVDEGTCRNTYEFIGWYKTSDCKDGDEFTQTTMPRGNKTVYAKWNLINTIYTREISFNMGNLPSGFNFSVASIYFLVGDHVNLSGISMPTKKHYQANGKNFIGQTKYNITTYTFAGWYTDAKFTNAYVAGTMPDNNFTLYAKWNISTSSTTTYTNQAEYQ